jgi:hypothetical protein
MKWHFQPSPHDTHDWDATQTPVLFDGTINGQPRKLIAQASRNGYFFVLDRATGKSVVTKEFVTNWAGIDRGDRFDPAKMPQFDGALVTLNQAGAASWRRPRSARRRVCSNERLARLQRVLPLRYRREARGMGRKRSRRMGRSHAAGDRLQDRQYQVES